MECLQRLCEARGLNFERVRAFFHRVKDYALAAYRNSMVWTKSDQECNRPAWRMGLDIVSREGPLLDDGGIFFEYFFHWKEASTIVERLLGTSSGEEKKRTNIPAHHKRNSIVLKRWGPRKKEEIATRHFDEDGALELRPTALATR